MDREAVTAPVAMSIAMALFLGFFATVALTSNGVGGEGAAEASDSARLRAQAGSLLELMLQSPGYSQGGVDWIDPDQALDPASGTRREDSLVRLGLREAGANRLSFDKFENLRLAPYASGLDGRVNYEEAREALGFDDEGLGFHIRAKPSLKSVQDILANGERDPNMRITYLAASTDSSVSSSVGIAGLGCTAVDATHLRVSLDVTNGGILPAQLSAFLSLTSEDGENTRNEWINGPEIAATDTVTLSSDFPFHVGAGATPLCGAGSTLTATIWDSTRELASQTVTLAGAAVTEHTHGLSLDTGTQYTLSGDDATFAYGGNNLANGVDLDFTITGPTGTHTLLLEAGKVNKRSIVVGDSPSGHHTLETGTLVAGTYTATLTDGTATVTETLYVFDAAPGDYSDGSTFSSSISDGAKTEVTNLHDLVEQFCPFLHDDSGHADIVPDRPDKPAPDFVPRCDFGPHDHGDVILDTKKNMDTDLPTRLLDGTGAATYDWVTTLVVGSNVNHQSMTSASAKHAVRDWVLGGGTIIVFGSSEQAVQWLQPIFHSGIQSSSGGIGTPDADHPLLQVSDTLAYDSYSNHGRTWDLQSSGAQSSADKFTTVVEDGDGQAILTISDPGAYGDGTIILTTWMPYDIFGDGSDPGSEGPKLVNNLLMQSYRGLFLDYGPPLPEGQAVVPATGKAQIFHPELNRLVSLDVTLFVFEQT